MTFRGGIEGWNRKSRAGSTGIGPTVAYGRRHPRCLTLQLQPVQGIPLEIGANLLGDLRTFRRLSPAYSLRGVVFCWECSLCHKLFMHMPHDRPPKPPEVARIASEFDHHDCSVQFALVRERQKKMPTA